MQPGGARSAGAIIRSRIVRSPDVQGGSAPGCQWQPGLPSLPQQQRAVRPTAGAATSPAGGRLRQPTIESMFGPSHGHVALPQKQPSPVQSQLSKQQQLAALLRHESVLNLSLQVRMLLLSPAGQAPHPLPGLHCLCEPTTADSQAAGHVHCVICESGAGS